MRLNKILLTILLLMNIINAKEETININFKNLQINDLIKITSKIINKNILLTKKINGKVDFISNKPVAKSELINVLIYVLESKGYTLIENNNLLRVIRINDASKYNVPVINKNEIKTFSMVTEIFTVNNTNVDYISSKIRHLISKSAKLVTDKESNSIIVTDFKSNIKTIKKVIKIISKDTKKYIKTVKLNNLAASSILADLKNVAKTIYNEKVLKEKVNILLNKDTNSIMFVGKKHNVNYLVNYLKNMDKKGSLIEKTVKVIYLKNAESKNIIKILSGVISNKKYKNQNDKPYVSSDEESNSIILMGQKQQLSYFEDLVNKLDIDRQQVYVQARIIEVSEKRTRDVGIKYGLSGSIEKTSGIASISATLAENFSMPSIPLVNSSGGIINKDILALGASINFLNQNGAADIVSEPSLLCLNNKKSTIYIGQTVSIKTATKVSSGGVSNDSFKREDVGLTLSIKPRISNGGKVLLEISTKLEDVSKSDGANGQPDTSKKELDTSAIVNNGESVILGGYIKSTKSITEDKVPFFGDIPILGALFRNERDVSDKINLIIIITPYIVPKSKDLTYIRKKLTALKRLEDKYTKIAVKSLQKKKKEKNEIKSNVNKKNEHQKKVNKLLGL
jgi:general secretion pathway protein D